MSASPEMTRNESPRKPGRVAHPAGGAEQLLLAAIGELEADAGAVAEVALDRLREPVQVGDRLVEAVAGEQRRAMCSITGRLSTGTIGFGIA